MVYLIGLHGVEENLNLEDKDVQVAVSSSSLPILVLDFLGKLGHNHLMRKLVLEGFFRHI